MLFSLHMAIKIVISLTPGWNISLGWPHPLDLSTCPLSKTPLSKVQFSHIFQGNKNRTQSECANFTEPKGPHWKEDQGSGKIQEKLTLFVILRFWSQSRQQRKIEDFWESYKSFRDSFGVDNSSTLLKGTLWVWSSWKLLPNLWTIKSLAWKLTLFHFTSWIEKPNHPSPPLTQPTSSTSPNHSPLALMLLISKVLPSAQSTSSPKPGAPLRSRSTLNSASSD